MNLRTYLPFLLVTLAACGGSSPNATVDAEIDGSLDAAEATTPTTTTTNDAAPDAEAGPTCNFDAGPPVATPRPCLITPPTWWATGDAASDGAAEAGDSAGATDATASADAMDAMDAMDAGDAASDASATDASSDAPIESGPSSTYPAFTLDSPRLSNQGGRVLDKPVFVTVSWDGEPDIPDIEHFVDTLGGSDYWNQVTCEYGVGPAVSGCGYHIHQSDTLPTTMSDVQVDSYIVKHATEWRGKTWAADPKNTIYIVVLPSATNVHFTRGGDSCAAFGGYHTAGMSKDGTPIIYAIIPRCDFGAGPLDTATWTISHELVEASTDPRPGSSASDRLGDPAFVGLRDEDVAWQLLQVGLVEAGDMCSFYQDSQYTDGALGASVQRTWSNASFAKGHNPCVPAPASPNFGAMPLGLPLVAYSVPFQFGGTNVMARGLNVPIGNDGTFDIGIFSDATTGPISLKVEAGNGIPGTSPDGSGRPAFATGTIAASVSPAVGTNGMRARVTVHVAGLDATLGANVVTIVASSGGVRRHWPVLITSN